MTTTNQLLEPTNASSKTIEEMAEEYYKSSGWVPTENAVMNFTAGAKAQKELSDDRIKYINDGYETMIDEMKKREAELMAVIDECKMAFTRINYNNYRGINQTIELQKLSADTLTSINEKLEKLNGK